MKPILYRAYFTPHSEVEFMTAFGSPITTVAMSSKFYGEGKIDQKETLLATVATWFPQTIYESFVYISLQSYLSWEWALHTSLYLY